MRSFEEGLLVNKKVLHAENKGYTDNFFVFREDIRPLEENKLRNNNEATVTMNVRLVKSLAQMLTPLSFFLRIRNQHAR